MGEQTFKEEETDPEGHDSLSVERFGPKGRIGGGAESARAGTHGNQLEAGSTTCSGMRFDKSPLHSTTYESSFLWPICASHLNRRLKVRAIPILTAPRRPKVHLPACSHITLSGHSKQPLSPQSQCSPGSSIMEYTETAA